MPRKPRIDIPGYHHVVNRGVNRENIFLCDDDKQEFLQIVNVSRETYNLTIHSFCVLDNHYHLLLETHQSNLSLAIRYINSQYTIYFNKKMERIGPLWQGRFKSWYVKNDEYLYLLFRYIEMNPVIVGLSSEVGKYPFSSSYHVNNLKKYELLSSSLLYGKDIHDWLFPLDEKNLSALDGFKNIKYEKIDNAFVEKKQTPLADYFVSIDSFSPRNFLIYEAFMSGYCQGEIARYLNLSSVTVSRIVSSERIKRELFNKLKDKGLFWSYSPNIHYDADKSKLLIETTLKYSDLDDVKIIIDTFGLRQVRKVWEVCLKNDKRFKRLNYFLARMFFNLDVEADYFAKIENIRGSKLRLLAG